MSKRDRDLNEVEREAFEAGKRAGAAELIAAAQDDRLGAFRLKLLAAEKAAAEKEREACARIADDAMSPSGSGEGHVYAISIARSIRARGGGGESQIPSDLGASLRTAIGAVVKPGSRVSLSVRQPDGSFAELVFTTPLPRST